jgi:GT2 family glycosyltransferase
LLSEAEWGSSPERDAAAALAVSRTGSAGKFLERGGEKLYVRGFTYGTFAPDADGQEFNDRAKVERDFHLMALRGANALRTYTVPPRWLLDCAWRHGLTVMVGIPWEQHVTFLDDRSRADSIVERVREAVRACARHPAVLCFAIGNEIPAAIVRWHGSRRVERFIERLYRAAKHEDPEALVTYVNFPSTEYLELPFLDLVCFNVYLEAREDLESYLARLQNIAGDRPLLMGEVGLDSRRNGEDTQAAALEWQLRSAYESGCAGAFVFAWTDEWHRGGSEIEDWDFGVTDRERNPKPALAAVSRVFADVPVTERRWPRISVVVCTHNGNGTLKRCMEGLANLRYPNYEVIFVDDGSTDPSAVMRARDFGFELIQTENRGLSSARNTGWQAANGEIVAYLDDDAWPDPDWLTYLATTFARGSYGGVGGPNIPPPSDGPIAQCVAKAPGGPIHVLVSDEEAEHIPGCNMAFRRDVLAEVGGFDPKFRVAGDDVDLCWRVLDAGHRLGFSPAAMVWHHRRNSIRAYWRQQRGYGKAEALLERKWPERYNAAGHVRWSGRLYGPGLTLPLIGGHRRVFHGRWGLGPFQSLYERAPGTFAALPLMPEWYLLIAVLAACSAMGALWRPLLLALPLLATSMFTALAQTVKSTRHASSPVDSRSRLRLRAVTALLYLLQPAARLRGRLTHGLSPWRLRRSRTLGWPFARNTAWSESWQDPAERMSAVEAALREGGSAFRCGGEFDRWDFEAACGALGKARARLAIEEHGQGRQLIRMRCWPRWARVAQAAVLCLVLLAAGAGLGDTPLLGGVFAGLSIAVLARVAVEVAAAAGSLADAFRRAQESVPVRAHLNGDPAAAGRPAKAHSLPVLLAPQWGEVEIIDRSPNPYASTFASEIVRLQAADGEELEVLVKSARGTGPSSLRHRGGVSYEARVYSAVLEPLGVETAPCYGQLGDGSLVLHHLRASTALALTDAPEEMLAQAAEWIGRFHAANEHRVSEPELDFLRRYDQAELHRWSRRARQLTVAAPQPWLEDLCQRFEADAARCLSAAGTVIHGEYYPENILCDETGVHPVDWESAAVAAGEIDLATLTEGWDEPTVARCEDSYRLARWPDGPPPEHRAALAMARIYRYLRWLDDRPDWTHLQRCAEAAQVI